MESKELSERNKKLAGILGSALYIFVAIYAFSAIFEIIDDIRISEYSWCWAIPFALIYGIHIPWAKKKNQPKEKIWGEMGFVFGSLAVIALNLCIIFFQWESFETWIGRICIIIVVIYAILKFSGWIGGGIRFKIH